MNRRLPVAIALAAALAAPAIIHAQAASQVPAVAPAAAVPPAEGAAPVLSDAVKSQIVIAAQAARIAELEAQRAISELEKARAALQQAIAAHTPAGYQLNDKLELVKLPEPKREPGKP